MKDNELLAAPISKIHMIPMDVINGFEVRPGMYEVNGATAIPCGVNFTVYSYGATIGTCRKNRLRLSEVQACDNRIIDTT